MINGIYKENRVNRRLVYPLLREGGQSLEDRCRVGRKVSGRSDMNFKCVSDATDIHRHKTMRSLCDLDMLYGTVQRLLKDNLNRRRVGDR